MIKLIISDLARTIIFPTAKEYNAKLNQLHAELANNNEDYKFFDYFYVNKDYLNLLVDYKKKNNLRLAIFTTGNIQNKKELDALLKEIFDDILVPGRVGYQKYEEAAYTRILEHCKLKPQEAIYIDDDIVNVNAARNVGLHGILNTNLNSIKQELNKLLN